MKRIALTLLLPLALTGCDRIYDRMGMPDPAKIEAEAKAIGASCRQSGRGLEECYELNPRSPKAAVFDGWKEMNEYMAQRNMEAVSPTGGKPAKSESGKAAGTAEAAPKEQSAKSAEKGH